MLSAKLAAQRVLFAVVSLALASESFAQEESVKVGDRVRVTVPSVQREPVVGTLQRLNPETCILQEYIRTLCVPASAITGLEVSQGRKSKTGTGVLIGGLVGLGLGSVVGASAAQCDGDCSISARLVAAGAVGALGFAAGAAIGAVIGASTQSDRWEVVRLDRLQVSVEPHYDGGVAIAAVVHFKLTGRSR